MKPLTKLEEQPAAADGHAWELWSRDGELRLMQDGAAVDSTRGCASVEEMARLAVSPISRANQPCVLVVGLGLGIVASAAANALPRSKARFIIAEPVPELPVWVREHSPYAKVLDDPRVSVEQVDAAALCRNRVGSLHAILMRWTHAPCFLSVGDASAFFQALKGGSLLAVLLARPDKRSEYTLKRAGFEVSTCPLPISAKGKASSVHTLVLARRGRFIPFAER